MNEKIIIAGSGGQGIMLLGKVLAQAAMEEGKFVSWLPAYGAEVRGGTAHCSVIISDEEIGSPYIEKADTLIIMNQPSLGKFIKRLKKGGCLIVNSSLVDLGAGLKAAGHPFTQIAFELGNIKVANMVVAGFLIKKNKTVNLDTVLKVIRNMAPKGKTDLLKVNEEALKRGSGL